MMIQASRRNKTFMQPVEILETLKSTVFAGESQWLQLGGNETVGMGWCQVKLNPIKTGA
jgi:CRISPR-associated protein Cmr4